MSRIPESELERLKLQVSMVRLVEAAGIALKPHGKDLVGRCPFHDDKTPSLVISPKSNLWHCLGACQAGGSVVDWVMRFEGVPFRRAVELLKQEIGAGPVVAPLGAPAKRDDGGRWQASEDDAALLRQVIEHYHATLLQSAEAQAYLAKRGLDHLEVVAHFRLGYANRTLAYQLPPMQVKAGAAIRGQLQRLGILRESSGHEHLNSSLVVPVRLRRDQQKYLALIDSIALLHQYQRPVRTMVEDGGTIEYVEATLDDIALANRLAHEVLGRSLDELPPHTRRLLGVLQQLVSERATAQRIDRTAVRFLRREVREAAGMSEKQARVHLDRLVELDYVIAHGGCNGQRFVYELAFDGDLASAAPQLIGLIDPVATTSNLVGENADLVAHGTDLVGRSWPARGGVVGTSSPLETGRNASADAGFPVLAAAVAESAPLEPARASHRNGSSYLPNVRN